MNSVEKSGGKFIMNNLPQLGDECKARDLRQNCGAGRNNLFVFVECSRCHQRRWASKCNLARPHLTNLCQKCWRETANPKPPKTEYGAKHPTWKGGKMKTGRGYILIKLLPDDFFRSMANHIRYVPEHRLIMAKHLGRNLHPWEIVHHKNGIKDDNRIENLQLVSDDKHKAITLMENKIKFLESKVSALEAEIVLLKVGD